MASEREPSSTSEGLINDNQSIPTSSSGPVHPSQSDVQMTSTTNVPRSNILKRGRKRVKLLHMEITCPICRSPVVGSEDEVNEHINKCVEEKESLEQVEEYEWAGYSKIRTTYEEATRLAGSGMLRIARVCEVEEANAIVDIEGDVNLRFGATQYTCNGPVADCGAASRSTEEEKLSSEPQPSDIKQPSSSTIPVTNKSHSNDPVSKCAVCLDPLTDPVVSVICWHVHCESCWLQALKVKKLCPRCTLITSFDDLRKVYL